MDRQPFLLAFGRNLARRRMEAGLSQEALGESAGLHRTYIGSVERGERNCTLTTLVALADGLGCKPQDLLADVCGAVSAS